MKKILVFLVMALLIILPTVVTAQETTPEKTILPTSRLYLLTQIKEFLQLNILTFNQSDKVKLIGEFANQRVKEIEYATSINDTASIDLAADRYQNQTIQALERVEKLNDLDTTDHLKSRILGQQKVITQTQLKVENNEQIQNKLVFVQKEIAHQVGSVLNEVQGEEAAKEFNNQMHVIWRDPNADVNGNLPPLPDNWEYAPGTHGRDGTGKVVIEGNADPMAPVNKDSGSNEVQVDVKTSGNPNSPGQNSPGQQPNQIKTFLDVDGLESENNPVLQVEITQPAE